MTNLVRHKATKITLTAVILASFGFMFYPFFTAILLAGLFGFALEPVVSKYSPKKKRRKVSTAILILGFFLVVAVPVCFVVYRIIVKAQEVSRVGIQNTPIYNSLNHAMNSLLNSGISIAQKIGIDPETVPDVGSILHEAGGFIVGGTTAFVAYLPAFILGLFIFTAALYFFLTESKSIKKGVTQLDLLKPEEFDQIIQIVQKSSYVSFVSTLIIGAIQALTVAIAAWVCGYREFFIVFVVTFVFALIPVIGAAPVAIALSLLSFVQGEIGEGIGLAVASVLAGTVDNVVKPLIVNAADEELHPVVSLIALIGAVMVYGIPGLLLGPVLTQLAFKIIPILFSKIQAPPPSDLILDPDQILPADSRR